FSIHSIPKQSLLQLGGNKVLDHIVSSLTRSNGSDGIYPLSNNEQEFFSFIYHHQDGPRYWLIIPAYQREHLRRIINEENPLICLEHGRLLFHLLFFDKHQKLIQYPNQFVILSVGVSSQSFTEDSSWSEIISFALPSWIQQGYAFYSPSHFTSSIPIDHQNSSSDQDKNLLLTSENVMEDVHPTVTKHHQLSSSLIVSPVQNSLENQDEENNFQGQTQINRLVSKFSSKMILI
ncbi:unnamed protein product, partial [Adineta steineri]